MPESIAMLRVHRLFAALLLSFPLGAALEAQDVPPIIPQVDEEAKVRAVLELYLRSHATGEGRHVEQAFHPQLKLWWAQGDSLATRTAAQYVAGHRGVPAADEAQRRRWIASVEVFGTAASARIVLDYPTITYVDFFTLLKINGEWKIVTKTFASQAKPRPAN
jgi:hypothetical protein